MARTVAVPYLVAESRRLAAECRAVRDHGATLRGAPFDALAYDEYLRRFHAFRHLLLNHRLAIEWTLHPLAVRRPHERN